MSTPISRREFLNALVPSWATRSNLVAGVIGAGVMVVVALVVSILREVGFLSILKLTLIGLGLVCILWLFGRLVALGLCVLKKSPPVVQALVVVIYHFAVGVALCLLGAYAYTRWQASEDKTGFMITVGSMLVFNFFGEWQKRRANQRPEHNAGATSPSTSESTPGVAHP